MLDEFGREMFPEDENVLLQVKAMVQSIWRGLHGSESYNQKGLIKDFAGFKIDVELRIKEIELRMIKLEQAKWKWVLSVVVFAIGFLAATGIYFGLSLKEIKNFVKP